MLICDAQVHIWANETPSRPWPEGGPARAHRPVALGADELLREMDAAGVHRAILVPPSWEGDYNDLVLQAAADHPDRLAIMGRMDIGDPSAFAALPRWREQKGMLGVRVTFLSEHHRQMLASGAVDPFWAAAEAAEVPLMILPPDQLPAIDAVATRYPKLRMVLDHLTMHSGKKDAEAFACIPDVAALAKHPNIAVKASALPCYTTDSYPFASIHGAINTILDAFGPDRTFWGTDLSRLPCSYGECVTLFTEALPFLDGAAKDQVMGAGICEWLGWPE